MSCDHTPGHRALGFSGPFSLLKAHGTALHSSQCEHLTIGGHGDWMRGEEGVGSGEAGTYSLRKGTEESDAHGGDDSNTSALAR